MANKQGCVVYGLAVTWQVLRPEFESPTSTQKQIHENLSA